MTLSNLYESQKVCHQECKIKSHPIIVQLVSSNKNRLKQVFANKEYATKYRMYYFIVVMDTYLPPIFRFSYIAYYIYNSNRSNFIHVKFHDT